MTSIDSHINHFDLPPKSIILRTPELAGLEDNPIFLAHWYLNQNDRWWWLKPTRSKQPTAWIILLFNGVWIFYVANYWLTPRTFVLQNSIFIFMLIMFGMSYFLRMRKIERNPYFQEVFGQLPLDLVRDFYLTPVDTASMVAGIVGLKVSQRKFVIRALVTTLCLAILFYWGLTKNQTLALSALPYGVIFAIYLCWSHVHFAWAHQLWSLRQNLYRSLVPAFFKRKQMVKITNNNLSTEAGCLLIGAIIVAPIPIVFLMFSLRSPAFPHMTFHIAGVISLIIFLIGIHFVAAEESQKAETHFMECRLMIGAALEAAATGVIAEDTRQRILNYNQTSDKPMPPNSDDEPISKS